jgi:hypothetical protein
MPPIDRKPLYVLSALSALLTIPATYALLRGFDVLFRSEANPATIVWSAKIAMFWRLGVGAYAAGMVAPLAFVAARANLQRTVRVVCGAAMVVAGLITFQGLLLP